MGAEIIALVAALIGAVVGAYLQKRWTPDYSAELSALRQQIEDLQKQHETPEQERAEPEHLRLDISLERGYSRNFSMRVENNSGREVTVEKSAFDHNGTSYTRIESPMGQSGRKRS